MHSRVVVSWKELFFVLYLIGSIAVLHPDAVMTMIKTLSPFVLALTASIFAVATAHAENCETIHFQRGHSEGTVQGIAPPDNVVCYEMTTGAGQTAILEITGKNIFFSIEGIVDAQDKYSFTTEKKTYRILVGQLMRSVTNQSFVLAVSIK